MLRDPQKRGRCRQSTARNDKTELAPRGAGSPLRFNKCGDDIPPAEAGSPLRSDKYGDDVSAVVRYDNPTYLTRFRRA